MVWILIRARLAPSQVFDVAIGVDIICALAVAIVANPALVAVVAAAPFHQRGLTHPRIVIILNEAAVFEVVRRVQRFAFRSENMMTFGFGSVLMAASVANPYKVLSKA